MTARRLGAVGVLAMIVTSAVALGLAMHRYPGGTELDRSCVGHSFWFNLLCDLTGERALNGAPNAARGFARVGMVSLAVGLGAFWLILPTLFPSHRWLGHLVRVAGAISVLGFLSLPVAEGGAWHALAVFAAAIPGVLAATAGVVATVRYVRDRPLVVCAVGAIVAATIDSFLYAHRVMNGFRSCPPSLPVFQRLTLLFVLAWGATTALRVWQTPPPVRPPTST